MAACPERSVFIEPENHKTAGGAGEKQKIAKLNARNDEIDKQVTELENLDIVGIVRRMGVTPDELAALMQAARPSGPQSADPAEKEEANYEET